MRIVVNADDFGATPDTVAATIACFEAGALTSATIMPGMPAADAAVAFALEHPELSFGVHLTFTGDGTERPLSSPRSVPALVDSEGRFLRTRDVRVRALLGRMPELQIERELEAQILAIRDRGVPVSHVDSHRHLHKLAPFRRALRRTLPRLGVGRVRTVQDVYLRTPVTTPTFWLGPVWRRGLVRAFASTDHFYMPSSTHDVDWAEPLLARCQRLSGASLEVGVHPGHDDPWRAGERASALELARLARGAGHELVPWTAVPVSR